MKHILFFSILMCGVLFSGQVFSQSVGGPSQACKDEWVSFYFAGCQGSNIGQGSWGFYPSPTEIQWGVPGGGGYTSVNCRWNYATTVNVSVGYSCVTGGSGSASLIPSLTVSSPPTSSVSMVTDLTSVCKNGSVIRFTATATNGGTTPQYYFYVDGSTATNMVYSGTSNFFDFNPQNLSAGSHTVIASMRSSLPCSTPVNSTTKSFTVVAPAVYTVDIAPKGALCTGATALSETVAVTGGVGTLSYQWYKNDVLVTTTATPTYVYGSMGNTDRVYCKVASNFGCVVSPVQTPTATLFNFPTATIQPSVNTKICSTCNQTFLANSGTNYSYTWKKDGVLIANALSISYVANQPGSYSNVVSVNGCTTESPGVALSKNGAPVVSAGANVNLSLPNNSATLSGYAYDADGTIASYAWNKVSGAAATLTGANTANLTVSGLVAGTYTFSLTATDNFGESASSTVTVSVLALANNYNYVLGNTVFQEGTLTTIAVDALAIGNKNSSYQYFDGLGRPMQAVDVKASPTGLDVVQPFVYDQFGRETNKLLPYSDGTNGYYKGDVATKQPAFYLTGGLLPLDQNPNSQITFEASPLFRPIKNLGPGKSWADNNKLLETAYLVNIHSLTGSATAEKIVAWTIDASGMPIRTAALPSFVESSGFYSTGQLLVSVSLDEQKNSTRQYTDKLGRVILKKTQVYGGPTANLNDPKQWASTYYVYDDLGNLRYVFPPEMTKLIHQSDSYTPIEADIRKFAFRYVYDGKKRLIEKQVPGTEPVYMVYDGRNRLVLSQDGVQRSTDHREWTLYKYDALNRPILKGILKEDYKWALNYVQGFIDTYYSTITPQSGLTWFEKKGTSTFGYTSTSYPDATLITNAQLKIDYLTVTYYDTYDFVKGLYKPLDYVYKNNELAAGLQPTIEQKDAIGQITGTRVKVLDGEAYGQLQWITSVQYYNNKYRSIQKVSDNYKGGWDRTSTFYDFSGKVLNTITNQTKRTVAWKNFVNAGLEGNKVVKNAGVNGAWDASATSVETLPANQAGWLEVSASEEWSYRLFGWGSQNPNGNPALVNYGLILQGGKVLVAAELGTYTTVGAYNAGDTLRIERNAAGQVVYKRNGMVLRTAPTLNTGILQAVTVFYSTGATVAYLKSSIGTVSNSVYREFTYDAASRLQTVSHKVNSNTKFVLSKMNYNELGKVIEKRLHSTTVAATDAKEAIDYRYNIRGWLTSINDPQTNPKLFAELLKYNDPTAKGGPAQFNGNISEMIWKSGGNYKLSYGYYYDTLQRLKDARFYNLDLTGQDDRYRETMGGVNAKGYDLNGNIRYLNRWGTNSATGFGQMDVLKYYYTGNQLTQVDDTQPLNAAEKGFKELTKTANEYTYDANGNMAIDNNKGITGISYNYLNLPAKVTKSATDYVTYIYDANGTKLFQQMFSAATNRRTDYAGEFTYQNDSLKFVNHDEGRVVLTTATPEYQYMLKDHLGNVRVTFTTAPTETETKTAGVEPANATTEQAAFLRYSSVRRVQSTMFDRTNGTASGYAVRLSGSTNEKYGLARSISVMKGDVLNIEVYGKYVDSNSANRSAALNTLLSQIAAAQAGVVVDGGAYTTSTASFPFAGLINTTGSTGGPKAYLNYLIFDRDYVFKGGGYARMSATPKETGQTADGVSHERLHIDNIAINQPGFVYIYFSNEEATPVEVYFDDFGVTQSKSTIVQQDDYYPFGLTFNSYRRETMLKQDYLFNGKELQDELNFGWLDYGTRMYQHDIGRWGVVDSKADKYNQHSPYNYVLNNPLVFIDPEGKEIYFVTSGGTVLAATEQNLKNTEMGAAYRGIMSTQSGRATWNTYAQNDKKDIYISISEKGQYSSTINGLSSYDLDKDQDGVAETDIGAYVKSSAYQVFVGADISKSKGKAIGLISLKKSDFNKDATEAEKFRQSETVFHEMDAHINIDDKEKQNHDSDSNHNSYGSKFGVLNWAKGSVAADSPAGRFVAELLNSGAFKLPDWLKAELRNALKENKGKK